jgi:hypothetical protein
MFTGRERKDVIGELALWRGGGLRRRSWIRTQRWSLDFTSEIDGESTTTPEEKDGKLIDLIHDPLEHNNLYGDPLYTSVISELEDQFAVRTADQRVPLQQGCNPYADGG